MIAGGEFVLLIIVVVSLIRNDLAEEVPAGDHRRRDECNRLHNQLLLEVEAAEEAS